jgi:hypothetical protein
MYCITSTFSSSLRIGQQRQDTLLITIYTHSFHMKVGKTKTKLGTYKPVIHILLYLQTILGTYKYRPVIHTLLYLQTVSIGSRKRNPKCLKPVLNIYVQKEI